MSADTTPVLAPCPFCGHDTPEFERMGTSGQSCIVACGNCGARHESGDEYLQSGKSWNSRAPAPAPQGPSMDDMTELVRSLGHNTWRQSAETASAVLARWGAPAASGKPVAWMHEEDPRRVISDAQREAARRDGGASWTSVRAYTVPLVRRP